jgi:hypothetical protein
LIAHRAALWKAGTKAQAKKSFDTEDLSFSPPEAEGEEGTGSDSDSSEDTTVALRRDLIGEANAEPG